MTFDVEHLTRLPSGGYVPPEPVGNEVSQNHLDNCGRVESVCYLPKAPDKGALATR